MKIRASSGKDLGRNSQKSLICKDDQQQLTAQSTCNPQNSLKLKLYHNQIQDQSCFNNFLPYTYNLLRAQRKTVQKEVEVQLSRSYTSISIKKQKKQKDTNFNHTIFTNHDLDRKVKSISVTQSHTLLQTYNKSFFSKLSQNKKENTQDALYYINQEQTKDVLEQINDTIQKINDKNKKIKEENLELEKEIKEVRKELFNMNLQKKQIELKQSKVYSESIQTEQQARDLKQKQVAINGNIKQMRETNQKIFNQIAQNQDSNKSYIKYVEKEKNIIEKLIQDIDNATKEHRQIRVNSQIQSENEIVRSKLNENSLQLNSFYSDNNYLVTFFNEELQQGSIDRKNQQYYELLT